MKLNLKILLFLFLAVNTGNLLSQGNGGKNSVKVQGTVLDGNGIPIAGVLVSIDEGKMRISSDVAGVFSGTAGAMSRLLFECPGYEDVVMSVSELKLNKNEVVMISVNKKNRADHVVGLAYRKGTPGLSAGNISVIDADNEYWKDSRTDVASAVNGKVSGSLGALNINGMGSAFTVVDGIPMGVGYTDLRDVEQIVVLKDAVSRMMYGVETDIPVILITTKTGKPYKNNLQFMVEKGVQQALAYPEFLDAVSYMKTYNKAYRNDGSTEDYYAADRILNTQSGIDPVLYPDNDYYSSEYVKSMSGYTNVYGTASGGNEKVRYLLGLNWVNNPGWNTISNTVNNKFNVRGRVDFEVNKWLKMNSQVLASYNITSGSNIGNFWTQANTYLPNAFPELIPVSRINNLDSLANYYALNGEYLAGGNSIYQNTIYGGLMRSGSYSQMQRYVQSRLGFDVDLSGITRGLAAHASVGYDFYNVYKQVIQNSYAVYEIDSVYPDQTFSVSRIGIDKVTTRQNVSNSDMSFNRSAKWNYTLNYDRTFGRHSISAVALGYGSFYTENDLNQPSHKIAFGGQASYAFADKYIVEGGILSQSSVKVNPSERFGLSRSAGLGWVVSNEKILRNNDLISYLKLRASMGQFVSDAFTSGNYNGYFLNENIYASSYNFVYNNGQISNRQIQILSFYNRVGWEKMNEFSAGLDVSLFNNKLWLDLTYTDSYSFDNVTAMNALKPSVVGGITTYENYNATDYKTYNLGLKYKDDFGDLHVDLAVYYSRNDAVLRKYAENIYRDADQMHLTRAGTDARGLWGLTAERLYFASDFDEQGNLLEGIPVPAWGAVKPGDIKYADYNGDGDVDDDDISELGRNSNNSQLSFNIDLKYKQWQLFLLPVAQMGGKGFKNSAYYWFKGNSAKYSVVALDAFDENNPDPHAAYPRLSLGSSDNNYRNSTFWMYDKSNLRLVAAQISYNLLFKTNPYVNKLRLFLKGENLFMLAKDRDVLQLNYGVNPQSRVFAVGAGLTF